MKYSEAGRGRTFIVRLEDGDIVHEEIERLAAEKEIAAAALIVLGGADAGSRLVVGPADGRAEQITPVEYVLDAVHEITGTGTLFPDADGRPVLHMHAACGRGDGAVAGCIRRGVRTWKVVEVVIMELVDSAARRLKDPGTGFELLEP